MAYSRSLSAYRDIDGILLSASQVFPATLSFPSEDAAIRWLARANFFRRNFDKYTELILSRTGSTITIDKHLPPKLLSLSGEEVEVIIPPKFGE